MQFKNFFERVYVVNLPERTDRRKLIVAELEKVGLPLTPDQVEIFPAIRPDSAGDFPSIGARGCFLSHLAILKQARQDRLSNVLIVEDDLAISEEFQHQEASLIEQLQQTDWGFVYFGHSHSQGSEGKDPTLLQPLLGTLRTTHFYGINGGIIDSLVEFLETVKQRPAGHPDGGPMHVDGAYTHFRAKYPDVLTLVASPVLGWQQSSRSDITPGWFDRTPIFKDLLGAARISKLWLRNHSV